MPVNRNALIRYRTIDKCLQNRRRKWTIEDLIEACNDALFEYDGIQQPISMRTIRMDLNAMRSNSLSYNAPIIVVDKKYYTYEDADYSITNIPLTTQDLDILKEVSGLLHQFKGFSHFTDMNAMIHKLDDTIYSEQTHKPAVIDFERNELLKGLEHIDIIHKAITNEKVLSITYQSFTAREAQEMLFSPYLLKEYRNRWFVLGIKGQKQDILNLALDRIVSITINDKELYKHHKQFNAHEYFEPIIGVTRNNNMRPVHVTFRANNTHAPYIKTKPLHASQTIIEQARTSTTFQIEVIPNLELERELLSFGDGVQVLAPASLVRAISKRVATMNAMYHG
jgi:predicted DNA-binding transcriptional regulator YafY